MVQTTRCHQLAMPIVYESAFTVFCDSPDNYRNGIGLEFLKAVPTTWDETKVLNASVADYITIARKSGEDWFIGSMTDADERELTIDFSFLDEGEYEAILFQDGPNANTEPEEVARKVMSITNENTIKINLAKGGGFAAIVEKVPGK